MITKATFVESYVDLVPVIILSLNETKLLWYLNDYEYVIQCTQQSEATVYSFILPFPSVFSSLKLIIIINKVIRLTVVLLTDLNYESLLVTNSLEILKIHINTTLLREVSNILHIYNAICISIKLDNKNVYSRNMQSQVDT